jgi:uncharacterized membrane protein
VCATNEVFLINSRSISAIALLANMAKLEIMAAGMFVSFVTLLLTASGLLTRISRLIPISIIRGIQLGTGFSLILKGIELINKSKKWNLSGVDGYYVAIASFLLIIITWKFKYSFSALLLFTVGILLSILATNERLEILGGFEPPSVPSLSQFYAGILNAGIGQLPLTLLNSVLIYLLRLSLYLYLQMIYFRKRRCQWHQYLKLHTFYHL